MKPKRNLFYQPPVDSYRIECRLPIARYDLAAAKARCTEIHGTTFDGVFQSGRYHVFWTGKEI